MSTQVLSKEVPIEEFVAGLRRFAEPVFSNVDQILGFVKSTPVAPDTLRPYLTWDRQHYTRNLIDKSPPYELVAICWEVGQVSSVHNHREQNCWMAVPIGRLMVENFRVLADVPDCSSQFLFCSTKFVSNAQGHLLLLHLIIARQKEIIRTCRRRCPTGRAEAAV